ncbi:adenylosuccinate lyase [Streptomyces sp. NBC_01294]|uniref:adenylosuccinate lyase n=1 Tax=Streptomyces sp. NBC_01294 TaxID=2903815 RepID=UPI002DD7A4ED|nr:adenylosuccinate lyase [Streptomyces sp. NBC_01294]WRZ58721.1 adenylosuccinate lyase [Streptomyces sp. NBC_01294]
MSLIERYSCPEMAELWTDERKYATWARVEVLASTAQAELGVVDRTALEDIRNAPVPSVSRVRELELTRDHEILAFLAAYTETMPAASARWVHHGMTSYDVVDTALGFTLARSCDLVLNAARTFLELLTARALEHWDTVCVARTHGVHAEPTTFGQKLAVHAFAMHRGVERLTAARAAVAVGTLSGPVGTYAHISPYVEEFVCGELGLGIEDMPTQVVARDRHAELLSALAVTGAVVEQFALEMRMLQRTEVGEVDEPRTSAYQGSSAMPHKRNPTTSERLCGLARILRSNAGAGYENVALWHERDLAHSSVERIVLPDSLTVAHYQLVSAAGLLSGLRVFPERMARNIDATRGLVYSSEVFVDLVARGRDQEEAYRLVQAAATEAWETGSTLAAGLAARGVEVSADQLDPRRFLGNRDHLKARLSRLSKELQSHVEV